jgi:hypothetical protein
MTQTPQMATEQPRTTQERGARPATEPSGWAGWVVFAGLILIMSGVFQGIMGLVALFDPGYYLVKSNGLVVQVDYNAWGWTHLVVGVVAILAGLGLFVGNLAARIAGVVLAFISALTNLAFIAAYPVWSTIVIALDVIVIYAVIVHGRELKDYRELS